MTQCWALPCSWSAALCLVPRCPSQRFTCKNDVFVLKRADMQAQSSRTSTKSADSSSSPKASRSTPLLGKQKMSTRSMTPVRGTLRRASARATTQMTSHRRGARPRHSSQRLRRGTSGTTLTMSRHHGGGGTTQTTTHRCDTRPQHSSRAHDGGSGMTRTMRRRGGGGGGTTQTTSRRRAMRLPAGLLRLRRSGGMAQTAMRRHRVQAVSRRQRPPRGGATTQTMSRRRGGQTPVALQPRSGCGMTQTTSHRRGALLARRSPRLMESHRMQQALVAAW